MPLGAPAYGALTETATAQKNVVSENPGILSMVPHLFARYHFFLLRLVEVSDHCSSICDFLDTTTQAMLTQAHMIPAANHQTESVGEFKARMIAFIRSNFSSLLGEHVALLDEPGGLDTLSAMLRDGRIGQHDANPWQRVAHRRDEAA